MASSGFATPTSHPLEFSDSLIPPTADCRSWSSTCTARAVRLRPVLAARKRNHTVLEYNRGCAAKGGVPALHQLGLPRRLPGRRPTRISADLKLVRRSVSTFPTLRLQPAPRHARRRPRRPTPESLKKSAGRLAAPLNEQGFEISRRWSASPAHSVTDYSRRTLASCRAVPRTTASSLITDNPRLICQFVGRHHRRGAAAFVAGVWCGLSGARPAPFGGQHGHDRGNPSTVA